MARERKLVRVKFAAERTLFHLLQFYKGEAILKAFCKVASADDAKGLTDFAHRVLAKMEASDEED